MDWFLKRQWHSLKSQRQVRWNEIQAIYGSRYQKSQLILWNLRERKFYNRVNHTGEYRVNRSFRLPNFVFAGQFSQPFQFAAEDSGLAFERSSSVHLCSSLVINLKVIHLIVAHCASYSFSLRIVFEKVVCHELDWVLGSLLGTLGEGLEQDRHDSFVEVGAHWQVL